jgi:hypothetical protein
VVFVVVIARLWEDDAGQGDRQRIRSFFHKSVSLCVFFCVFFLQNLNGLFTGYS